MSMIASAMSQSPHRRGNCLSAVGTVERGDDLGPRRNIPGRKIFGVFFTILVLFGGGFFRGGLAAVFALFFVGQGRLALGFGFLAATPPATPWSFLGTFFV